MWRSDFQAPWASSTTRVHRSVSGRSRAGSKSTLGFPAGATAGQGRQEEGEGGETGDEPVEAVAELSALLGCEGEDGVGLDPLPDGLQKAARLLGHAQPQIHVQTMLCLAEAVAVRVTCPRRRGRAVAWARRRRKAGGA